jgi:hypothetical protein
LQINLSAGDCAYAALTVPRLVASHGRVAHRLAIVDCCRPQRTKIFDPDQRTPMPAFAERVATIRRVALEFRKQRLFDDIVFLEPGDPRFAGLARRYVRPWMTESHDYGGCAFMAYWAALALPSTRFVAHYDADMLLHTEPGHDWTQEALSYWSDLPQAIAAAPRISPPGFASDRHRDGPSRHEGRPLERVSGGWLNDWFSTRCLLIDRARLDRRLPLLGLPGALEMRLRRVFDRGYPPVPEQVLFRSLGRSGYRCLHLKSLTSWLLHPNDKNAEFARLLPQILSVVESGNVPVEQRGCADLRLDAWAAFLDDPRRPSAASGPSCASS